MAKRIRNEPLNLWVFFFSICCWKPSWPENIKFKDYKQSQAPEQTWKQWKKPWAAVDVCQKLQKTYIKWPECLLLTPKTNYCAWELRRKADRNTDRSDTAWPCPQKDFPKEAKWAERKTPSEEKQMQETLTRLSSSPRCPSDMDMRRP